MSYRSARALLVLALVPWASVVSRTPAFAAADTQTPACATVLGDQAAPGRPGQMDYLRQVNNGDGTFTLTYQWSPSGGGFGPIPAGTVVPIQACAWIDADADRQFQAAERLFGKLVPDTCCGAQFDPALLSVTVSAQLGDSVCAKAGFSGPPGVTPHEPGPVDCQTLIASTSLPTRGPAGADRQVQSCGQVIAGAADAFQRATFLDQRNNGDGTFTLWYRYYNLQGSGGPVSSLDYQSCLWVDNDRDRSLQAGEPLYGRLEVRINTQQDFFNPVLATEVSGKRGDTICVRSGVRATGSGQNFGAINPPSCVVLGGAMAAATTPRTPPGPAGHVAPAITTSLRSPGQISLAPIDLLRSAILAGGLLVLVGFPSQVFNSTFTAHYPEVMGWFGFLRRRGRKPDEKPRAGGGASDADGLPHTPLWTILLVFVFSALIGGFLDPKFGFDLASLEAVLGILGATLVTTLIYTGMAALLMHSMYGRWGGFRIFPGGVAIALGCVVVSKATGAQPGYIYGVMLSYTLGTNFAIPKQHEGRLVAAGALVVLVASLGAWFLWSPVKEAARASAAFPLVVASTTLSAIFLGGMCSLLFGLFPLRFLDGEKSLAWRRLLWGVLFGLGLFLFVHVVLNATAASAHPGRSYTVAVAFFAVFGVLSIAFWAYFRFRPEPATAVVKPV